MSTVFLSVGSNVEPAKNIPACLDLLRKRFSVTKVSSVYETDPVGPVGNLKFWNLAVAVETNLKEGALMEALRQIESELGRRRDPNNKFAPRTIDLDIVPSPESHKQSFVLIPLAEIAPRELDPETGKSFGELAKNLAGAGSSRKITSS